MAIHKRGYQRYDGSLTSRWARLLVLPRFAWGELMSQRFVAVIFMLALFWPVACLLFVYLSNNSGLLIGFPEQFREFLAIDGRFFVTFMNVQATSAVLLAAFAGPSLIAPDLGNGALSLYFSRPFSRPEYMLSRMLVLLGVFAPVTWIPGLALFSMQSGLAGWSWFTENWMLGVGIFFGFMLWVVFVSLVAMTCSAYVKWRMVAGGLVLGVFFVLAGASEITGEVLQVDWPLVLNPAFAMNQIWRSMLGADAISGPDAIECLATVAALSLFMLIVLDRKIRPVEVLS